jgi:hypothetical protein
MAWHLTHSPHVIISLGKAPGAGSYAGNARAA